MYACVDKSQMWEHHGSESVYRENYHNASWVVLFVESHNCNQAVDWSISNIFWKQWSQILSWNGLLQNGLSNDANDFIKITEMFTRYSTFLSVYTSLTSFEPSSSHLGEDHCTVPPWPGLSFPPGVKVNRRPMHGEPGLSLLPLHPSTAQKSSPRALECLLLRGMGRDPSVPSCASEGLGRRSSAGTLRLSHHTSSTILPASDSRVYCRSFWQNNSCLHLGNLLLVLSGVLVCMTA